MAIFEGLSLWLNLAIFAGAAAIVWLAGTRIAHYAEAISQKTGLGEAVLGVLLLGGITSLPEVAVTVSASATGNSALAANNIFGGIAMQVAIIAIADFVIGKRALSSVVPDSTVLLQGSICILLLGIAAAGIAAGDVAVLGIGLWLWALFGAFLYGVFVVARSDGEKPWVPHPAADRDKEKDRNRDKDRDKDRDEGTRATSGTPARRSAAERARKERNQALEALPLRSVLWRTAVAGAIVLVAGYALSQTGDAIAKQTGLGASFVGAALVAAATSLPEVSTTLAAARLGLYTMAISDIFGTNMFDLALLFVSDAAGGGGALLNTLSTFSIVGALLGIVVTALYVAGLAERRDKTILRVGIDSASVLAVYIGGLLLLYQLR